jgi:hypothetical protein
LSRISVLDKSKEGKYSQRNECRLHAMSIISEIAIFVGSFFILIVVADVATIAYLLSRKVPNSPPAPPFRCPACGSEDIEIYSSGLWDGVDSAGRGTSGDRDVGTCKSCNTHCTHVSFCDHDKRQSRYKTESLTDAEWQREIEPHEKFHRRANSWPFEPEEKSSAT